MVPNPDPTLEQRIGEAWSYHRQGDQKAAIDIFKDVIQKNPKDVDANYGLGLAYRANQQNDEAVKAFQVSYDEASRRLKELRGDEQTNNLDTYEDDRYMMLLRMLTQRLTELNAAPTDAS